MEVDWSLELLRAQEQAARACAAAVGAPQPLPAVDGAVNVVLQRAIPLPESCGQAMTLPIGWSEEGSVEVAVR